MKDVISHPSDAEVNLRKFPAYWQIAMNPQYQAPGVAEFAGAASESSRHQVLLLATQSSSNFLWERDFLAEIIPVERHRWIWVNVDPPYRSRWQQVKRMFALIARSRQLRHDVLIFSSNDLGHPEIRFLIRLTKPKVLIHLSDEWGTKPEYAALAQCVPLVVRQHHHGKYREPENVVFMPLGYMTGMLGRRSSIAMEGIPPMDGREHLWSFAGNPRKQERAEALRCFTEWNPGVQIEGISPDAVFELYTRSVFVPSPRGNVRLDCFRLYEASIAGAIPVVAGSSQEIADTFHMEEDPPWIIASTWKTALETCQAELEEPQLLQARQDRLRTWWKKRVLNVAGRIRQTLS